MRTLLVAVVLTLAAGQSWAQAPADTRASARVSLIYTGRSLGALGVLRNPSEHELVAEQARKDKLPVGFVTNLCWRAGSSSFLAADGDLEASDLADFLGGRISFEPGGEVRGLSSNNVILFEDARASAAGSGSLLDAALGNPRAGADFPDLRQARLTLRRGTLPGGRAVFLLSETTVPWPQDAAAWARGEVNRIDIADRRLYEVAINLGPMGSRATLLARLSARAASRSASSLLVDLGHRDGDLGLERLDRARVDYAALARLGYRFVVPYEFELAIGADGLGALRSEIPQVEFIASNVKLRDEKRAGLFSTRTVVDIAGVKVGLAGLVDPDVAGVLAASALADFSFEDPLVAAAREVAALRREGADAVILLSNLHPRDNNYLARELLGVDAIVADLHVRWSPETMETSVVLPDRPLSRPGSPALVPRSFANGLGLGALDLGFERPPGGGRAYLRTLSHVLESVTDRVPADSELVADIRRRASAGERPRGPVLLPPFSALVQAKPELGKYDATAAQGRISKRMWEEFLARLIRERTGSELGIVRKLPHFPPAVGALHEAEIRAWLWTEDAIVTLDVAGADLKSVMAEDRDNDLAVAGLDRRAGTINGRRIQDAVLYRVATSDLLLDGARFRALANGRRIDRRFRLIDNGRLKASRSGETWLLKDFVLSDLRRLQALDQPDRLASTLAALLDRDRPFVPLVTFSFDRPTLLASVNRVQTDDAYGSVSESRVNSPNSFVFGTSGRWAVGYDRSRFRFDFGTTFAYGRLSQNSTRRGKFETVTSDDFRLDFTVSSKRLQQRRSWKPEPLARVEYDTQFSRTRNPVNGTFNPRENLWRGYFGVAAAPGSAWQTVELTGIAEHDLTYGEVDWGIGGRAIYRKPFGAGRRVTYVHDSQLLYLFTADHEESTGLGLRYRMLHELLIPLAAELSLSVGVDVLVFRGKARSIQPLGWSTLFRAGITYDRLWKPRYQPFF